MKEILVNLEGYNQFFEEFEKLSNSLTSNAAHGSEVYADAVGDGWHDNFAYEDAMRKEKMIQNKINDMLLQKDSLIVVDDYEYSDDVVCINDTVLVTIFYDEDDCENEIIKLTGKYLPDDNKNEVSLNSPIGKALYRSKIGTTISYEVNSQKIKVYIIRKVMQDA